MYYQRNNVSVYHGDNRVVLPTLGLNVFDGVCTDSPYGLGFMGKQWDHGVPGPEYWSAIKDACKPGAAMLAFGGTRTYHRLACAIEAAGWEIRDCLMWLYSSGFPKSLDISKALDKRQGFWRGKAGEVAGQSVAMSGPHYERTPKGEPITDEARKFDGYGTALKPAWEPIILAMKPLDGDFAANAAKWGVAGLNIDGARIPANGDKLGGSAIGPTTAGWDRPWKHDEEAVAARRERSRLNVAKAEALGRWPANLLLDEEAAAMLDKQCPISKAKKGRVGKVGGSGFPGFTDPDREGTWPDDPGGGVSRFFYCSKASRNERNWGLAGMPELPVSGTGKFHLAAQQNNHPTVKPLALMRYLLTLLRTPSGGLFLDPFAGSGSTLLAALQLGLGCVGIELEEAYCQIIRGRLEGCVP